MNRSDAAALPPIALAEAPASASGLSLLRLASLALFGATALLILFTFNRYGISNDEEVQHVYGRLLLEFYRSGFHDQAAFDYKNLYLYGGMFDLIAAALERVVPMNVWDLRHLLSALFGLAGMVGAWRLAGLLAGERAGIAAAGLLLLTGAWSGGMFTHTKDVPFAACMVWSLYYVVRVARELPAPSRADVAKLGIALGAAFGLRVGAVFAVFYLGVATLVAAWLLADRNWPARARFVGRSILALVPGAAIALAMMAFFWPWSVTAPDHLYEAIATFSRFAFPLKTILAGRVMDIAHLPGSYLSIYLLVRLPELFLVGLSLAALFGAGSLAGLALRRDADRRAFVGWLPVVLAALFPIAYTLVAAPPLYNGIRHFLFLLPPLAVCAAVGLERAWQVCARRPQARAALTAVVGALALWHGASLYRLHPYSYVYYNQLVGGLPGAAGRWEMDYWSTGLREAAEMLDAHVAAEGRPDARYLVAVCAEKIQGAAFLDPRFTVTSDWLSADFFLSTTHMDCHNALRGRIIGAVVREGVPLAVVRDRRDLPLAERHPR